MSNSAQKHTPCVCADELPDGRVLLRVILSNPLLPEVEPVQAMALVDTGASVSLISSSLAERLQLDAELDPYLIKGVLGEAQPLDRHTVAIQIPQTNFKLDDLDVAARPAPPNAPPPAYQAILGMNALRQATFHLDPHRDFYLCT